MKHILVIGGTGRIARPVVYELVKAGYQVWVMARNPEKGRGLLPREVEFFAGDLADVSQLAQAVAGMDAIYINLPEVAHPNAPFIPDIHGIQNILRVASKNMVLMKLSQLGVYENPRYHNMTFKYRAEEMIRASGFPYMIFQPTWFMESLPLILRQGKSVMVVGKQPHPLYWIAGEDLGRQVASALHHYPITANRTFPIQGLNPITFGDAAKIYADAHHLKVSRLPMWAMYGMGLFSRQYRADYQLMAHYNRHPELFTSQATWDMLGKPTITLHQFVKQWRDE